MGYNPNTNTFDTIASLRLRSGINNSTAHVLGYYAPDDKGGGNFYYDTSSIATDDGGLVIKPTAVSGAGRWLRIYSGRRFNFKWWGAISDDVTDNLATFYTMVDSIPNIPIPAQESGSNMKGVIYIPGDVKKYFFSDTIDIVNEMVILGDEGSDGFMSSNFLFPTDTMGMHVKTNTVSTRGAHGFHMKNIKLWTSIGTDTTAYGILINRPVFFDNVHCEGFTGHQMYVNTTVEGIADLCHMVNCSAYYGGESGLKLEGVDSNQCKIEGFNSFGNMRWGIDDQSFLGNVFIGCHTNVNTNIPGNPVWAFHNDLTYACIQNHTNKEPGVAVGWESYWILIDNPSIIIPSPYYPAWSNSFAYKTGGAYNSVEQAVSSSSWIGCYSEGGQAPSDMGQFNTVIGGIHGAGFRRPYATAILAANNGSLLTSSGLVVNARPSPTEIATEELTIDRDGYSIFPLDEDGVRITGSSTALNWSPSYGAFTALYAGAGVSYWITTALFDPSWVGLSASPGGIMHFPTGHFLGSQASVANGRRVEMGDAVPIAGTYAKGDIKLKIISGAGDTILGWRCTVAGTPGTWETLHVTIT